MRITCPTCQSRFRVDAARVPTGGFDTTCSVCSGVIRVPGRPAATPARRDAPQSRTPSTVPTVHYSGSRPGSEAALSLLIENQQKQGEMSWLIAKELTHLREVIERQQSVLSHIVHQVTNGPTALPRPTSGTQDALGWEIEELQAALDAERQVVDRLRRSKLHLERRAANAETALASVKRVGFLNQLLGRADD